MATFGVTPITGFAPPTDEGFPRFIQFQLNGENVGDTTVEVVNFIGDVDLTLSSDGSTVTVEVAPQFEWVTVTGDYTLQASDVGKGIRCEDGVGTQTITVPGGTFEPGDTILILAAGAAAVEVQGASGVAVRYRAGLTNAAAGQWATLTLIADETEGYFILCGDLGTA